MKKAVTALQPKHENLEFKRAATRVDDSVVSAKMSDFDAQSIGPSEADPAEKSGALIEQTAAEDENVKEVDTKTYWKILDQTGGLAVWVLILSLGAIKEYFFLEETTFWMTFASLPADEQ